MKSRRVSITDHSFTLSSSEDNFHFTLRAGMLKGTSSTLSPLVKFKAVTFRDNAGLRKV